MIYSLTENLHYKISMQNDMGNIVYRDNRIRYSQDKYIYQCNVNMVKHSYDNERYSDNRTQDTHLNTHWFHQ